ncbi:MAG: SDR family oxidoreductase [Desulfomonilia bacterium]|jgi:3-dehydrosphinganine reductase
MAAFSGKLAFITGGSSGIGYETALLLASRGCSLVLFARGLTGLERARESIAPRMIAPSQRIEIVSMDVADNDDVVRKITGAVEDFGTPDILINSAGVGCGDYFENISYERFDQVMKINVYGTRNTIDAVLPFMKRRASGHIVNLSSAAGLIGIFGYTLYSATKYALVGFSECLRSELKRYGIHVTVVCPPEVRTPFIDEESKTMPPEGKAVKIMAGRLDPDQVACDIVKALERRRFLVVPGRIARFMHFCHRISNGRLTRTPSDWIVAIAVFVNRKLRRGGQGIP